MKLKKWIITEVRKDEFIELQRKYIKLLEEKANGFDKYIEYHDKCKLLTEEKKQLKKEIAELKENLTNK